MKPSIRRASDCRLIQVSHARYASAYAARASVCRKNAHRPYGIVVQLYRTENVARRAMTAVIKTKFNIFNQTANNIDFQSNIYVESRCDIESKKFTFTPIKFSDSAGTAL